MKQDKTQPAKKSYFFGPGFQDIGAAIKTSWQRNAQSARRYYERYGEKGLMSFQGVYYLFCALSVVTFGTIFFAAISAVMLTVVSVFFIAVYLGFSAVWLFDRAYLTRHKIFTACGECKSKFLIPTYLCPNCGTRHSNLTPGAYGILHRTCNCGQKLPATFFGGRRKLRAICPHCFKAGRATFLNDRESRPLCIPVVGGRSVGKTAYITAFSKRFVEFVAPQNGLEVEFYDRIKETMYAEIKSDYARGSTHMTARSMDLTRPSSISFSFFVKHKSLKPERLVHIYDIAGEVFTDSSENEVQQQYEYCQGIIFILDPFAIPTVRARYGHLLNAVDAASIGKADINGVIDVFINKLREVTGLTDQKMYQVPIAVVIGKTDSAGLRELFSDEQVEELLYRFPRGKISRSDALDYLCRRFLIDNDMQSVVNAITLRFKTNRFFAASAIGHSRDAGPYNPTGVLEPVEWICTQADPQLAALWVKGQYGKKPLTEIPAEKEG